jgi:hypothetical protein
MTEYLSLEQIRQRDDKLIEDVRELLPASALAILREHDFVICPAADYHPHQRQYGEAKENARARQLERQRQEIGAALRYYGAILHCQASVAVGGRSVSTRRCHNRAKWATRVSHDRGDGRLVVCSKHLQHAFRYMPLSWELWGKGATEIIEPEYQPRTDEEMP